MTKLKKLAVLLSLAWSSHAWAQDVALPYTMQLADGINPNNINIVTYPNGAVDKRKNVGPGNEQSVSTIMKKNGQTYIVTVYMSNNVTRRPYQIKCSSVVLRPEGPQMLADQVQLTNLGGTRPANHPTVCNNGDKVLMMFGSDGFSNNVQTYATVLDEQCRDLSATNGNPHYRKISDNNNQNEGAPACAALPNGSFVGGYYQNGANGASYFSEMNFIELTQDSTGIKYQYVNSNNPKRMIPGNIGRPTMVPLSSDRTLFCSAQGNNRPPEVGVKCCLLKTDAASRDQNGYATNAWCNVIAQSNPNPQNQGGQEGNPGALGPGGEYYNSPQVTSLGDGLVAVQAIEGTGEGKNKNKKGASREHIFVLRPTDAGPGVLNGAKGDFGDKIGYNHTHASICSGEVGADSTKAIAVYDCPIFDNAPCVASFVKWNAATNHIEPIYQAAVSGERGSGGYLANMLGENPGTQGREFVSCQGGVANPGFGVAGGFMPKVKNFFIMPFTGRKDPVPSSTTPFAGQWLSLVPGALASGSQPPPPPPGDGGGGGTVVAGDAGGNGPSFSDGCSMAPGANTTSGGAVMLLLAGAWLFLRRRSLQPERAKSRRSS